MTKIYVHGILAKKFGSFFQFSISNAISALKAIDANKEGFLQEIKKLNKFGLDYFILVDDEIINNQGDFNVRKKISNIHIVPSIVGSGAAIVMLSVGAQTVGALTAAQMAVAFLINAAITAAISLGVSMIMANINKQAQPPQQFIAVGGASAAIEAQGKNYIFNNVQNVAAQGISIPVGFGRLKVASVLIEATVKNYSTSESYVDTFLQKESDTITFL
jgi:predicted phage tail protein